MSKIDLPCMPHLKRWIYRDAEWICVCLRGVEKKWGVTVNEYKVCLVGEEHTLKLLMIMA